MLPQRGTVRQNLPKISRTPRPANWVAERQKPRKQTPEFSPDSAEVGLQGFRRGPRPTKIEVHHDTANHWPPRDIDEHLDETVLNVRIAEIFESVQGEGEFAGTPSVFVRTTGCNLRCWFCDTPYTSIRPEGFIRDWREVVRDVLRYDSRHVVLTGGEPLLQADLVPLAKALRSEGRIVTIETAGTVFRDVEADLMSISPKLASSTPPALPRFSRIR